jgi:hypothetical protein
MGDSGEFNIEIDAEEGIVLITDAQGVPYTYTVEELEGKGVIDRLKSGGATEVVYSQGGIFTRKEYQDLYGDDDL